MVRTYNVNALTQSDSVFSHTHRVKEQKIRNTQPRNASAMPRQEPVAAPADPAPISSIQHQCSQCRSYDVLHSPYADPVGSIVGLRVVYMDGKITYVPVEPQINYLINKQFGPYASQYCAHPIIPQPAAYPLWDYNSVMPRAPFPAQVPMQNTGYGSVQSQSPPADPGPPSSNYPMNRAAHSYNVASTAQYTGAAIQNVTNTNDQQMRYPPHYVQTPQAQPNPVQRSNNVRSNGNTQEKSMEGGFFFSNPQPKSGVRRSREWMTDDKDYNPWGKGGGGSPLKDEFGNLVADRRQLGRSWKTQLSTNQPHHLHVDRFGQSYRSSFRPDFSNNNWHYSSTQTPAYSGGGGYLSHASSGSMPNLNRALSDSERHKMELQQQIEENKKRKEYEKQKEREVEQREMRKHEEYMERLRRNEEEEKRREREKAILADKRRQQLHEEQQRMAKQMKRVRTPPRG